VDDVPDETIKSHSRWCRMGKIHTWVVKKCPTSGDVGRRVYSFCLAIIRAFAFGDLRRRSAQHQCKAFVLYRSHAEQIVISLFDLSHISPPRFLPCFDIRGQAVTSAISMLAERVNGSVCLCQVAPVGRPFRGRVIKSIGGMM
jgi:hypothetical protein